MKSKRDQLEIIMDVMEVINDGYGSKSSIMKYANLSNTLLEKYISILTSKGLIKYEDGHYKMTEKGIELLEKLRKIRKLHLELSELINSVSEELY
ncbi:winged helix-turn-helix domain-containing protein [Acidianus hospitalis]|jgi:predicted transcriptional regulator|uniref:ArnR1-like winged helix-turn-helix domain-containing protein n=1 Tax=Acidianus hospitalis (strain W1) TaxID=933801 RepID=F4B574_ACIHW|nr:winged helix-turn-helix domain-containing protein [Acidianus hospitalis]AEE94376.1 conserved hypothetical protein [Acidianus hospitalis W1]MDT7901743.1 winged helix-turn-helix domain-containing protein [Acidianus sp.]